MIRFYSVNIISLLCNSVTSITPEVRARPAFYSPTITQQEQPRAIAAHLPPIITPKLGIVFNLKLKDRAEKVKSFEKALKAAAVNVHVDLVMSNGRQMGSVTKHLLLDRATTLNSSSPTSVIRSKKTPVNVSIIRVQEPISIFQPQIVKEGKISLNVIK